MGWGWDMGTRVTRPSEGKNLRLVWVGSTWKMGIFDFVFGLMWQGGALTGMIQTKTILTTDGHRWTQMGKDFYANFRELFSNQMVRLQNEDEPGFGY